MPKAREHRQKHRASRTESVTGGRAGDGEGEDGITLSPLTPAPVPIAASVLTTETAHLYSDDRQPDVIEVEATVPPSLQDGGPSIPRGIAVLLLVAALAQSFSSGAISLFINKDLAFQPVEATQYWMYVGLTMWSQPLVGWMSDSFTPFGERRRPLFVLSVSCSAFIFMLYAVDTRVTQSHATFVLLSLVNQIFIMGAYIPLNGLLVEVGKKERENSDESGARMAAVMSQAMTIRSVGSFGGSLLQTILLLFISVRGLLGVTSVLHVAVAFIMLSADASLFRLPPASTGGSLAGEGEENARGSHEMCEHTKQTCKKVRDSFDIHDIRSDGFSFVLVLLFVFFYNAMPDASVVYYSYLFSEFNFPTWFYSMNGLVGALASTIGAYLFSVWMTHRSKKQLIEALARASRRSSTDDNEEEEESPSSLRSACRRLSTSIYFVFVVGSGVWALAYLTNLMLCTGFVTDVLHIPAKVFVPVDNFFVSLCVRFAFMPTIIMAAEHAPKHFEATAFEVFSVASMAGGTFSSLVTSAIAHGLGITRDDSSNLYIIIIISVVFKLAPIPVAYYLPQRRQATDGGGGGVDTATATAATAATDIAVVTVEDAEEDARVAASHGNDNGRGKRKSGSSSSSRRKKRERKPSSPSSQEVHAALSAHEKKKKKSSSRDTGQTAGGDGSTTNDNGDGEDDAVARAGRDERARLL